MSYARRQEMGTNRPLALIIVGIIHVLLGYALVSGLAHSVIQRAADDLKAFNVEQEPPPPDESPPPPPEQPQEIPPPIVSPPPIVRTKGVPPPAVQTVREAPPPVVTRTAPTAPPAPPARPAPPPPPPVLTVPPRSAVGELQGLFEADDYPRRAIEREEQGTVTVRLTIGANGRVEGCDITSSSGSRTLDNVTCRILESRASFTPARDNRGNRTTDTVSQRIRWVLEG